MNGTITYNGKAYPVAFNMKARRLFMEKYGLKYMSEYADMLKKAEPDKKKGVSLEGMYILSNLIITAMQSAAKEILEIDEDDFTEYMLNNQEDFQQAMTSFRLAQETEGKKTPKPDSSGGKSKGAGR